jgi:hypothetical protein
MNPIACISVDVLPEPRGESPAPGVTGDADSAEFGLALAMASAAQSQAVVVPAPLPTGDVLGSAVTDAVRTLGENVTDALARPSPPVLAPLPSRPVAAGLEGTPPPAAPAGPEAKAPLPSSQPSLPARPVADKLEGTPPPAAPARPEPVRSPVSPAVLLGNAAAPATTVAAEVAIVARDASLRTADLPLTVRVLELVRGMTEQAARIALDVAMSAGPAQDVALEAAPQSGRAWSAPGQSMPVAVVAAEESRQAFATRVLEALPGAGGPDRSRPAARTALRPLSEAVTQGEAVKSDEARMARGAVLPRDAAPADPPMPVPRSDVRLPSEVPGPAVPVPVSTADERGRGRSGEPTRDGDGPTRAAGAMLAEASAAARASLADESVPVPAGPGSSVPPNARAAAGSVDQTAGPMRAAVPQEARTPARLGDQVTLQFSGEGGLEGQLRVAVRGQNVRATILADDPVAAERFSRGLDGLQRALLDRGFSEARLNVQQTARSEGSAFGNVPRDGNQGDSQPRGEGRDRYSSTRQERESASPEDRPDRRSSRQRTER